MLHAGTNKLPCCPTVLRVGTRRTQNPIERGNQMIQKKLKALLMSLPLVGGMGFTHEAAAQSCQNLSDAYAIYANKGFGFAPANVQTLWKQVPCATTPTAANIPMLCQQLSDRSNLSSATPGTNPEAKGAYGALSCQTKPTCQGLSDTWAIYANKGFGLAPPDVQATWKAMNCGTTPTPTRIPALCQQMSDQFGLGGGLSGIADANNKGAFAALSCKTKPVCQGLSNGLAIYANKGFGFAPADVQAYWKTLNCSTTPAPNFYAVLCQELSNRFKISPTTPSTNAEAQGAYQAMGCKTLP